MEDNSQLAYMLLGLIIIIGGVVVIGYILGKIDIPFFDKAKGNEIQPTLKQFQIESYWNKQRVYDILYQVYDSGLLVQQGELKQDTIEIVHNIRNDTNYTLKLYKKGYYDYEGMCDNINPICSGDVYRKADVQLKIIPFTETYYRVLLYIQDGVVITPKICVADNIDRLRYPRLKKEGVELLTKPVPDDMRIYYDVCYSFNITSEIKEKLLQDIVKDNEYDIAKYNKAHKIKYTDWSNITFTNEDYQGYVLDKIVTGLYEFDLYFETNTEYTMLNQSEIKVKVMDSKQQVEQETKVNI